MSALDFFRDDVQQAVNQVVAVLVLPVVFTHRFVFSELSQAESYQDFVHPSLKQIPHDSALWILPQRIDSSSTNFYGRSRVEIITEDKPALQHRFQQSADYCVVEEALWRRAVAPSASSKSVIVCSSGAGADGDANVFLVQGWGH